MNQKELYKMIADEQPNICQVHCYKDNKVVYSEEWNNYKKDDTCHVMSVTKSVIALLIGIAIDKGFINSINEKVLTFFPDYQIKRGEKTIQDITIKHLLTMKAPYKCKGDPWTKVCSSEDWTKASLDLLGGRKGLAGEFNYQTVCLHILSGILYQATNRKTVDFANQYLFEPIGIEKRFNYYAETVEEHKHFTMCKEPKTNVWFCDPTEIATPGYGLCLSAEDMAKIGLLCLNEGKYNDKQIISSEWMKEIFKVTHKCDEKFTNMSYGYLWWIIDEKKEIYSAVGNSGNVIYINKPKNIVIAVASYFKPTILDRVEFIREYIEPLLLS